MGMLPDNKYQITPDGVIFTVQEDGTIRRFAKISSDGNIEPFGATEIMQKEAVSTQEKKSSGCFTVVFIILLIAGLLFAAGLIVQYEDRVGYLNSRVYNLEYENRNLKAQKQNLDSEKQNLYNEKQNLDSEKKQLAAELKAWGDEYPIIIKDIQVRNQGEAFNRTIYSENTTFISPKIVYKSLDTRVVKLDIKFLTPSGLSTGTGWSKGGYSYSDERTVYKGGGEVELIGWGSTNKGHWSAGKYRYEIWCNGHMLKDKVFYIEDGF
ncbi:hypothetical protein J5690_01615 [bacterium]|nr:hypothetical protein [bacterium]